jgi:CheY-like chemotaxis protein
MPAMNLNCDPSMRVVRGDAPEPVIRVLVIEDDDMDQEVLLDHLKRANVQDHILFISDSRRAAELLLRADDQEIRSKLCAVFLDLMLPGFSGIEILRLIRSTPEIASLPVIVMTGLTDPKVLEECRKLKATSYLKKPLAFRSFCMAVANIFHLPAPHSQGLVED